MKAVIQRVTKANVKVDGNITGKIDDGLLILLGVTHDDTEAEAKALAKKAIELRIFNDNNGKMNLSVMDIGGRVLVISQFTLYADCSHGRRPSFIKAARPEPAEQLYEKFCEYLMEYGIKDVQKGIFGADMKVSLLNDGPVTIILDTDEIYKKL